MELLLNGKKVLVEIRAKASMIIVPVGALSDETARSQLGKVNAGLFVEAERLERELNFLMKGLIDGVNKGSVPCQNPDVKS